MHKLFLVGKAYRRLIKVSNLILISLVVVACGETPDEEIGDELAAGIIISNSLVDRAYWRDSRSRFTVRGDALLGETKVKVYDEQSQTRRTFIGSADVASDGSWRFDLNTDDTSKVPCRVYVASEAQVRGVVQQQSVSVSDSPGDCGSAYTVNQVAQAPNGSIDVPATSIEVAKGTAVTFNGSATDPNGDTNLTYLWDFGAYTTRKPGQSTTITFDREGEATVKLLVKDSTNQWDPSPDSIVITVLENVVNTAPNGVINSPSASATINIGETVNFSGSGTDPEGGALIYYWDFGASGNPDSTQKDPGSIRFNNAGSFIVSLYVTDPQALADPTPAQVTINVLPRVNQAPNGDIIAPSGNQSIQAGQSISFSGSASDPDGDSVTHAWSFGGSGVPNSSQRSPGNVTFNTAGTFVVTYVVTDETGLPDPTPGSVIVTVNSAQNQAPNGDITLPNGNRTIEVGQSINFNGVGVDPDGDALTHVWSFGGSGNANSQRQSPGNVQFNNSGTFVVTYVVTDSKGLPDPTPGSVIVTVNEVATNNPPNGTISQPVAERVDVVKDNSLTFRATATDPDGDSNLRYTWDFGSYRPAASGQTVTVDFDRVGEVTVKLNVRDSSGKLDPTPDTVIVNVLNETINSEPDGTITSPSNNRSINVGDAIDFAGTGSDPDGGQLSYLWDFGGSGINSSTRRNPGLKVFNTVGIYNVSLVVTDDKGLSDSTPDTVRITVSDANNPPNGSISTPSSNQTIDVGQSVFFSGNGVDPDGDTISYAWNFGSSGIPSSTQRSPGTLVFNTVGEHRITLTVSDDQGLVDPTPSSIMVTVNAVSNNPPNANITQPTANVNINIGESVYFASNSNDPDGDAVSYLWDFGNSSIPQSTQQTPGLVTFDSSGTYVITLSSTDEHGLADPTPDTVSVVVNGQDQNPNGSIISSHPANILVGDTLTFIGDATHPDGDQNLRYVWNFGSYAPAESGRVVSMTFNSIGQVDITLNVRDSNNNLDPTPPTLVINVVENLPTFNLPPQTVIGVPTTDRTIDAGQSIFFSGLASDPENNEPLNYFWNFDGAAPNSTIQNPGSILFNNPGVYRVSLTSTDSLGMTDPTPDVRIITVSGASDSPPNSFISSPSSDQTIEVGDSLVFSGVGVDPDNDFPISYFWNFDGVMPNSQLATPGEVTFTNAGVYNISLRVTDGTGTKDPTPATVQVTVTNFNSQNEPPNSTIITPAMNLVIYENDSLEFRGTGTDPDGDTISYLWDFDGAAPNRSVNNPGNIEFSRAGTYNISLTTTDSSGLSDPTPAIVRVTVRTAPSTVAPNSVITSPTGDLRITKGEVVNFSGYGTDADGDTPLSYLWNFDGAATHVHTANPGNVAFVNAGTYRVRFSVTDSTGLTDPTPAERIIVVEDVNVPAINSAPGGNIDSPASDVVITVGQAINFTGSGVDPDGDLPLTYRWNFGGIVPNSTIQEPGDPGLVTFTQVGTYRVVLTVTDAAGLSDPSPAERLVTVVGNTTLNSSPNATIVSPSSNLEIDVDGVVNFSGSGTDPDNNTPLTYVWDFDGALPNVIGANPGNVTFKRAGTYTVKLKVIDSLGAVDSSPAQVIISVVEGGGNNGGTSTPTSNWPILNPTTDVLNVNVGDSYTFRGTTVGLDGDVSSFRFWNFNGYTTNVIGDTASKTFDRAGTFTVDYRVKDSDGAWDHSPDSVTVIVH